MAEVSGIIKNIDNLIAQSIKLRAKLSVVVVCIKNTSSQILHIPELKIKFYNKAYIIFYIIK